MPRLREKKGQTIDTRIRLDLILGIAQKNDRLETLVGIVRIQQGVTLISSEYFQQALEVLYNLYFGRSLKTPLDGCLDQILSV